jgi:hypothetical protein
MTWEKYKVSVPEGALGDWRVGRFTVDENAARMSALRDGYRAIPAGEYMGLSYRGHIIMSDAYAEIRDFLWYQCRLHGHVLFNGLGLGVHLGICLLQPDVTQITVIELSPDVIALVGEHWRNKADELGKKLEIIEADAMTWQSPAGVRYGFVWHDIWPDISADNLPSMVRLHRRYGRRVIVRRHGVVLNANAGDREITNERWIYD